MAQISISMLLAALGLFGCAVPGLDGGVVSERRSIYYGPHLVQYAGRWSGRIPVVLHGVPFGSAAEVAAGLRVPAWAGSRGFEVTDAAAVRSALRLVIIFDPALERPRGHELCAAAETIPLRPVANSLSALGAFCDRNEALSQAFVAGERPSGASDPRFSALPRELTGRILVLEHPVRPRGTT